MKIFVISLESAKERRIQVISNLEKENLDWNFHNAINGADIHVSTDPRVDTKMCLRFPGYLLKPNEVACFLSHRELWKKSVALGESIVILEDDAVTNKLFKNRLKEILSNPKLKEIDILRLGNGNFKIEKNKILDLEDFSIFRYREDPLCALAYIISPRAANKLIKFSERFSISVDNYIWQGDIHGCVTLDVSPHFFQSKDNGNSTIGNRRKPRVTILMRIKIEFYRAIHRFKKKRFENKIFKRFSTQK